MDERKSLEEMYLSLGKQLEQLKIKNFKNHCFWRIANDNACNIKWNDLVKKPFYKNADDALLLKSVEYLVAMLKDTSCIAELNRKSLQQRFNS